MASADGLIIAAGALALTGNFKTAGTFPNNGYGIVAATTALAFLASTTKGGPLERPVKAMAGLMLLVAVYVYIPGLVSNKAQAKRKAKKNG